MAPGGFALSLAFSNPSPPYFARFGSIFTPSVYVLSDEFLVLQAIVYRLHAAGTPEAYVVNLMSDWMTSGFGDVTGKLSGLSQLSVCKLCWSTVNQRCVSASCLQVLDLTP